MLRKRATTAKRHVSHFSGALWSYRAAGWHVPGPDAHCRPRVARPPTAVSRRGLLVALAILILAACGGGPSKVQARLVAAATDSGRPAYFLGARYGDLALDDEAAAKGEVSALYGVTCDSEDGDSTCRPSLEVRTTRFTRQLWQEMASCQRLDDVRGVPALSSEGSLQVLTASSVVSLLMDPYDWFPARKAASALRAVTTSHPTGDLPPPTASVMRVVEEVCGAKSG
jgi:hypothetical protein